MTDDEGDSLGGRLGRYAKVGASMGGLAARLAGQRYLGWTLDRDKHASELKAALGGLKGPLMKAAQLIATIPDALPPEYARELAQRACGRRVADRRDRDGGTQDHDTGTPCSCTHLTRLSVATGTCGRDHDGD